MGWKNEYSFKKKTEVNSEAKESPWSLRFFIKKNLDLSMLTGRRKGEGKRSEVYKWERTASLRGLERQGCELEGGQWGRGGAESSPALKVPCSSEKWGRLQEGRTDEGWVCSSHAGKQEEAPETTKGAQSLSPQVMLETHWTPLSSPHLISLFFSFYLHSMLDSPKSEFVFQCCTVGCIRSHLYFINQYASNHVDISGWVF